MKPDPLVAWIAAGVLFAAALMCGLTVRLLAEPTPFLD